MNIEAYDAESLRKLVRLSQEEPSFYVYGYKSNDTNNTEGEYLYSQTELLEGFEKMLNIYLREVYETE